MEVLWAPCFDAEDSFSGQACQACRVEGLIRIWGAVLKLHHVRCA